MVTRGNEVVTRGWLLWKLVETKVTYLSILQACHHPLSWPNLKERPVSRTASKLNSALWGRGGYRELSKRNGRAG